MAARTISELQLTASSRLWPLMTAGDAEPIRREALVALERLRIGPSQTVERIETAPHSVAFEARVLNGARS
jgi:hypothetical protein